MISSATNSSVSLLDQLFSSEWISPNLSQKTSRVPVNIIETKEAFKIEFAAPGFKKENFTISVEANLLAVQASNETKELKQTEQFAKKEFCFSSFTRKFTLPDVCHGDKITASYENGILKLFIPKQSPEQKQKKVIDIV